MHFPPLSLKNEYQMGHLLAVVVGFWLLHVTMSSAAQNTRDCSALQAKLQAQRAQLKQNLMAEASRECTFKPKTNKGQNRELIDHARILKAEDEASRVVTAE